MLNWFKKWCFFSLTACLLELSLRGCLPKKKTNNYSLLVKIYSAARSENEEMMQLLILNVHRFEDIC